MRHATYGGQLALRRLSRVSRALRGRCLFVVMTSETYSRAPCAEIVRRACGLPGHVAVARLPYVMVVTDEIGQADDDIMLRTNIDDRSFAYPAFMAAFDREFGADFQWWDDFLYPRIRLRGPGWEPVDWDI